MRHYDVQLIGGDGPPRGKIAEMKTGEGKTLVAPCRCYLNALSGKGVHVVTVNDYLAKRDAEWMGQALSASWAWRGRHPQRTAGHAAPQAYAGRHHLRHQQRVRLRLPARQHEVLARSACQRGHHYAHRRRGRLDPDRRGAHAAHHQRPDERSGRLYNRHRRVIPFLQQESDYLSTRRPRSSPSPTSGIDKVEARSRFRTSTTRAHGGAAPRHQSLKAHTSSSGRDYVVEGGKVIIVDEFTGRLMHGRRWSDGLHQAVEAKEKLKIEQESQTYATITFQNLFRMYDKLAGMTGTADTEADGVRRDLQPRHHGHPDQPPIARIDTTT
jgi:preprotein translocase subunit SecA